MGWDEKQKGSNKCSALREKRRYVLDDSKRFAMTKTHWTVSNKPNSADDETTEERHYNWSLRRSSELTQSKERADLRGKIICEEVSEKRRHHVRGRPAILRGLK